MSEQQTATSAIDEHIAWLTERVQETAEMNEYWRKRGADQETMTAIYCQFHAYNGALNHARLIRLNIQAAKERSGE